MTAIVGIEHGGRVYMAGDRALSGSDVITSSADPKVWARAGVVYGVAGNLDQLQRVRYEFKPAQYRRRQRPELFLGSKLAPAFREFFGADKVKIEILVGVRGSLYLLDRGFSFSPVGPEWAIGSGGDAARASLMHITGPPSDRAMWALDTAARVCLSVAGPFDVVSL